LGDVKIENDQVLYLIYKKEGTSEYEDVNIQKPSTDDSRVGKDDDVV